MANLSINEFFSSIAERGLAIKDLFASTHYRSPVLPLIELCHVLLTSRGEASGIVLSQEILSRYQQLSYDEKSEFFQVLLHEFSAEQHLVEYAARHYLEDPTPERLVQLSKATMPSRVELITRINHAPDATQSLVDMRQDLLHRTPANPELKIIDNDFVQLFTSWFNRGFLELRKIDWQTSAVMLEKIIQYEAVHTISGWDALRERIEPEDRQIYGFFHPRLRDEPLIFVEVALMNNMPSSISQVLASDRKIISMNAAKTAVFYSISNCQIGLRGVPLGNFLIKQVVEDLQTGLPNLEEFVTLSPVPSLNSWFRNSQNNKLFHKSDGFHSSIREAIAGEWRGGKNISSEMETKIVPAVAWFLRDVKNSLGHPVDPVARFHLGNGARLERINWNADLSDTSLQSSMGIMVNYRYHPDDIERNHEQFKHSGLVICSPDVTSSANKFGKSVQLADAK